MPALKTLTCTWADRIRWPFRTDVVTQPRWCRPSGCPGAAPSRDEPHHRADDQDGEQDDQRDSRGEVARRTRSDPDRVHAGVQHLALLEGGPQRAVQAVLEVEVAVPLDDVGEQVAEERRVLVEQRRRAAGCPWW